MNIADNLERTAFYFPKQTAVICENKVKSFAELDQDAGCIAAAFKRAGLEEGAHVALCAPNSYEWLAVYFGVLKVGAVAVTISHLLKQDELQKILMDCNPKILFTTDDRLSVFENMDKPPLLQMVVCEHGDISYDRLVEIGIAGFKSVQRRPDDVAAVLYTGGTTGVPKGAMLTHLNLQTSTFNVAFHERAQKTDLALCFLPLNHVFAQVHIMHATIFSGGGLLVQNGFDMASTLAAIEKHAVTKLYAVPTVYIRWLDLPDLKHRIRKVRYCFSAAASMAAAVVKEWKKRTGLNIHEAYGMTESASMVTYNHYYRHVIGSVGTPVNLVEVQVRDPDGNRLPADQKGEIYVRGPNIAKGYLNSPGETAEAFQNDWFRSGDIGVFDRDGYLYIVDRLKDMIITGGENVYAREIEEVLYTFPEVSECAVIGLPDREYGERVTAFIVSKKGGGLKTEDLKNGLKMQLANYKVPKTFVFVEALPKNNAGKLLKRELKKQFAGNG